jgi:short-subunit dehydrogenase
MNIVITGCSSGIGFETVLELLKNKDNKVLGIARNKEKLSLLKDAVNSEQLQTISLDITKLEESQSVLQQKLQEHLQSVDVLINNAGLLVNKYFESFEEKEIDDIITTNFKAPAALIKFFLPWLEKSNDAHIVNISSMGGFQGSSKYPGLSWYSASKAALAVLTECLAVELTERNIKVNCLALGAVNTDMLQKAFPGYKAPIEADEMAKFIADFAMNGQKIFNGQILPVRLSNP